jgi:hypothetical protein
MAAEAKRKTRYATYGSVAYAPGYDGSAARRLEREVVRPLPKERPEARVRARPRARVREQGRISVFAVVGFLAVGVFAALVLMSYVRLTTLSSETISLRSELSSLQTEEAKLQAQYELAYDIKSIEEKVTSDGQMVKPQSWQIYTVDLSEPDTVKRYNESHTYAGAVGALYAVGEVFKTVVEYFR